MIRTGWVWEQIPAESPPENVTFGALPAVLLTDGAWPEILNGVSRRIVLDAADAALLGMMPEESLRVRMNFLRELSVRLRELATDAVHAVILSPDLDRMTADPGYRENTLAMFRSLAGGLFDLPLELGVRLRLPHPESAAAIRAFLLLLQSVPGLRGVLELHPHEPAFAALNPMEVNPLRMPGVMVEILYARMLGNRLTAKLMKPVLDQLRAPERDLEILFRPGMLEQEALAREMTDLEQLLPELEASPLNFLEEK